MKRRRKVATGSRQEGNALLRAWCAGIAGDVLSVGSGDDGDREGGHYRDYFAGAASYVTSDVAEGCDLVLDVRSMYLQPGFDAIFAHSVLEHVDEVFMAARSLFRCLKPGGVLMVGVPFRYRIHRAPKDYWRFTVHGLQFLLGQAGFRVEEIVGLDGPANHPAFYWARAVRD